MLGPEWLYHPLGVCQHGATYIACRGYNFWSGIGSDIGEITLVVGLVAFYLKHTCHVSRCYRWAKHPVQGTPYTACGKHHPTVPQRVTVEHIEAAHAEARRTRHQATGTDAVNARPGLSTGDEASHAHKT